MKSTLIRFLKSKGLLAFLLGFVMYIVIMLPDLIPNGGIIYGSVGDYNTQVVPFTHHIRDAYLSGSFFGWDWSSGMGSDFIASYAYYNMCSPFTFLYLLIPEKLMGIGITIVTAVKYGTGSLLVYLYIKRYVANPHFAVIGGLLYAFSSFAGYNIVYHFTDVIMLFPIILIGMDELCLNNRRGLFAITVAVMAFTNYYFFFGQALFCVLYFSLRCVDRSFSVKKLLPVAAEAVLGCGMAMALLLPVFLSILSSGKATGLIAPEDMLLYTDIFDYLKILQSAFMVPDPFGFVSLFPENEFEYPMGNLIASVAAYIPLFSCAGVISYMFARRRAWESLLLGLCVIMSLVPVLNQSFSMFNSAYYARWYYMPILIAVMVSVRALEEGISFKPGIIACSVVFGGLLISQIFITTDWIYRKSIGTISAGLPQNLLFFAVTAISLAMLIIIVNTKRDKEFIAKLYIFAAIGCYTVFGAMSHFFLTSTIINDKSVLIPTLAMNEELPEDFDKDGRIALRIGTVNYNLIWGLDSITCFNSLYDNGYIEFVEAVDFHNARDTYNYITANYPNLCDLLSVKYYFVSDENFHEENDAFHAADFGPYSVFQNENYIPMGFTYDSMISSEAYSLIEKSDREQLHRICMRSLVTDTPEAFEGILPDADESVLSPVTDEEYYSLIERHRSETCYDVEKDNRGLTAKINLEKENVVFFSISHNDNWSAFVDGVECEIHNVNNGLTGVIVPEGEHTIQLRYITRGLGAGVAVSCVSVAALAAYLIAGKLRKNKNE